jgi:hypothetical protein
MKTYLFIFFTVLASSAFNAIGQSKLTEQDVKALLCHKWKVVIMEVEGEQHKVDEDLYITFLKDGTFIDSQDGNKPPKLKWTYNHSTMTVKTGGVLKILKIDDKELKLKSIDDGKPIGVTLKRVD